MNEYQKKSIDELVAEIKRRPCAQGKCYTDPRYEYARRLWHGEGIGVNKQEAFVYFEEAADFGHEAAQYKTALCYFKGEGITRDYKKALNYFERLSKKHHWQQAGYLGMGKCYLKLGDVQKAFECLHQVSDDNRVSSLIEEDQKEAQFLLGMFYYEGIGCEQDLVQAFKYFEKAARGNSPCHSAWYYLVICYQEGKGTAVDTEMAKHWALKCFELNYEKIVGEIKELFEVTIN